MVSTLVVVRHGSAGEPGTWHHDDRSRPLDRTGLGQALDLAHHLHEVPIDHILTSPYTRCHHTVSALAGIRRLPVTACPWLGADTSAESVAAGLATVRGAVLLCTHHQVLPHLAQALHAIGRFRHRAADLPLDLAEGAAWRLDLAGASAATL